VKDAFQRQGKKLERSQPAEAWSESNRRGANCNDLEDCDLILLPRFSPKPAPESLRTLLLQARAANKNDRDSQVELKPRCLKIALEPSPKAMGAPGDA
jgi:hypothetical protein